MHTREHLFHLVVTAGLVKAPVSQQQVLHYHIHYVIAMSMLLSFELL